MQLNMKYLERFTLHKMGCGAKGWCVVIWLSSLGPGCSIGEWDGSDGHISGKGDLRKEP